MRRRVRIGNCPQDFCWLEKEESELKLVDNLEITSVKSNMPNPDLIHYIRRQSDKKDEHTVFILNTDSAGTFKHCASASDFYMCTSSWIWCRYIHLALMQHPTSKETTRHYSRALASAAAVQSIA